MIIKCLTRKSTNFSQIIKYLVGKEDLGNLPFILGQNLNCMPHDIEGVIQSFKENDKFRKKRKGGVVLYHDILSLPIALKKLCQTQPWLLEELATEYISLKAPHAISFGVAHFAI